MRFTKPPKRSAKPPLNPGSMKAGAKGGTKSKLMQPKAPPRGPYGPGKDFLP
jgi:hypothetical protein